MLSRVMMEGPHNISRDYKCTLIKWLLYQYLRKKRFPPPILTINFTDTCQNNLLSIGIYKSVRAFPVSIRPVVTFFHASGN
jgi:hypothetical protein